MRRSLSDMLLLVVASWAVLAVVYVAWPETRPWKAAPRKCAYQMLFVDHFGGRVVQWCGEDGWLPPSVRPTP